jgi:hypothetical protein
MASDAFMLSRVGQRVRSTTNASISGEGGSNNTESFVVALQIVSERTWSEGHQV